MAFEVVMPRLGWNMEVGALAGWRKRDGDSVRVGEILFEVESDKAVQEVESLESGILHIPPDSPPLGQPVPVGTLLAYLARPGEQVSFQAMPVAATLAPASAQSTAVSAKHLGPADRAETPQRSEREHPTISPRAARVASELGVDWTRLKGSGRTGRIVERDVRQEAVTKVAPVEI